ncbi:MAG: O-antigen ligase family protein [Patescibacteria group bacterium]
MIFSFLIVFTSIIFAFIAWRDLKLAILLVLFALPTYLLRFQIGPIPTTLLEVLVLIVIGRWLIVFASESKQSLVGLLRRFTPRKDNFLLPILILFIAATVGVIVSPDALSALGAWKAYFIEPILFFFIVRSTLKTKTDVDSALKALGCSTIVVSVFGIIQWLTGLGIPPPWDIEGRIVSVFDFPNAVGLYLGPIVTLAIARIISPSSQGGAKGGFTFWILVIALGIIAIVLAQTEATYIAIPASLLLISFFNRRWRRATIPLAVIGIIAVMMIPSVRQKLTLRDYSGEVRRTQWSETLVMLKDRPLFGAGLAGYPTVFEPYHQADWIEVFQYPHNVILNIWSELGILGLLAFAIIAYRLIRSIQLPITNYQLLLLAALVEMTIHGLVDVPYFKNDLALMTWTLLALLSLSFSVVKKPSSAIDAH